MATTSNADAVETELCGSDDDLIGDQSDFDLSSDSDDDAPDANQKPKAKLRDGSRTVADEIAAEAAALLKPLPKDFKWINRLPEDKPRPLWEPIPENDPANTPDLTSNSLLSIFLLLISKPLEEMARCTNIYGRMKYPKSWPELDTSQLVLFVAIIFHMDVIQRKNLKEYWNKVTGDSFILSTEISRKRFLKWYETIHLYVPNEMSAAECRQNRIYKVEKYLMLCQLAMQKWRHTTNQKLSLDEEMTTFKGRCGLIQLIKGKPRGEGLKYYAICDPNTGYVYATILHSGTHIPYQEVWGRIVAFCYKLLSGCEKWGLKSYLDQGFYVYTDRYYSTVQMNYGMSHRKTYFCGTLRREQRSSLPTDIMLGTRRNPTPAIVKALKRGQTLRQYSNSGETCAISWMDNTLVTFLTSIDEGHHEPVICYRKTKTKGGSAQRIAVSQPLVASDFNWNMGGVDRHDQNTTDVKKHHRSRRWYISGVFLQSLDWAAHNAFILWKDFHPNSTLKNKDVKENLSVALRDFGLFKMTAKPTTAGTFCRSPTSTSTSQVNHKLL